MYNSIHFRDYPVILAGILLFSLVFVLVNLCASVERCSMNGPTGRDPPGGERIAAANSSV